MPDCQDWMTKAGYISWTRFKGPTMKKLLAAACVLAASSTVSALEIDFDEKYLIGTGAITSYDDLDDSAIGFGVGVGAPVEGIELIDDSQLFIEAGYNYLGEVEEDFGIATVTVSASTIYGAGRLSFEIQDEIFAYGKLGLNMIMSEVDAGSLGSEDDSEIKLLWGAGVGYQLNDQIALTAEYVSFASDVTSFTGNVQYKF